MRISELENSRSGGVCSGLGFPILLNIGLSASSAGLNSWGLLAMMLLSDLELGLASGCILLANIEK